MNLKSILIICAATVPLCGFAQKLTSYKATNGITYHIDDTLKLNKGSGANGTFLYIEDRGINFPPPPPGRSNATHYLPKDFTNGGVIIKSMRMVKEKNLHKCLFMVNPGGPMRYSMFIDDAIAACEVKPCSTAENTPPPSTGSGSVADEIKKLKALMDEGAITKDEYEKQKKKLLGE